MEVGGGEVGGDGGGRGGGGSGVGVGVGVGVEYPRTRIFCQFKAFGAWSNRVFCETWLFRTETGNCFDRYHLRSDSHIALDDGRGNQQHCGTLLEHGNRVSWER